MTGQATFHSLTEAARDKGFVKYVRDGVSSWAQWYQSKLSEIHTLNTERQSIDGVATLRVLVSQRDAIEDEQEQRADRSITLNDVGLSPDDYKRVCDIDERIAEIENNPDFILTSGKNNLGLKIDVRTLNGETRCVLTAMHYYREHGSSSLLVADHSRLEVVCDNELHTCEDLVGRVIGTLLIMDQVSPVKGRYKRINVIVESVLNDWGNQVGEPHDDTDHNSAAVYLASELGQRDHFIYRKRKEGLDNRKVIDELSKIFAEKRWEPITTPQGIRDAIKRYCIKTKAPQLTRNKSGRPRNETAKP
ncbi:hypothetical protein SAMN06265222_10998 [Neorhodopirellula lusitana]|uniref:Uncharacterized protein n=1 Tax=Neorhodopirellula lusitana TaxID=445327 RepID=A0ABY1QCS1_9BACT|nr:hypothetical protein [Neorhodopirellula lusitana]SMP65575.1 hypothetical protein SAMN06265222_10998 [Neorhodopirellula lusitana]